MLAIAGGGMRTGSVAVYQIMRELVEVTGAGHTPTGQALGNEKQIKKWANDSKWVVLKYHGVYEPHVADLDRVRAVVTYRNQLDVVVSLMNFRQDPFESVMASRAFYSNIVCHRAWQEAGVPVLFLRYETCVVKNRPFAVMAIARFLDIDLTEAQARAIEEKWNIKSNKVRAAAKNPLSSMEFMAERHIWSDGESRWKEELTEEQVALVEEQSGIWLKENGYGLRR